MGDNVNVIQQFQDVVSTFANDQQGRMNDMAGQLTSTWMNQQLPTFDVHPHLETVGLGLGSAPDAPAFSPLNVALPGAPNFTLPTLGPLPSMPTLSAVPSINTPSAPSLAVPGAPNAPVFTMPVIPAAPSITLPNPPTLQNVVLPTPPVINLPTFSSSLPIEDLVMPTFQFQFAEAPYQDALLDELKRKLLHDLVNGGYGIEPLDEAALWERERERELLGADELLQQAVTQSAAFNFSIPTGAAMAVIQKAQQQALEKISSVNRDIALKRSELYVQNRQFTIQQAKEVEQMLLQYWGSMMERSLNAARAIVELGIAAYNARLARANYMLERVRIEAQIFETQVRAALAQLEVYKGELEGARLAEDVQRLHVEVFRTFIESAQATVELYRTQMGAAQIAAQIEEVKLGAFKATVEAYAANISAKALEVNMYEAAIHAEQSKAVIYQAQTSAFAAECEAIRSQAQAQIAQYTAAIEGARVSIEAYRVQAEHAGLQLKASIEAITVQEQIYEGKVRAFVASNELDIKRAEVLITQMRSQMELVFNYAKVTADVAIARGQIVAQSANVMGQTMAGVAESYGRNASAAISSASSLMASIASG